MKLWKSSIAMSIINKSFWLLGDIVTMKVTGNETGGRYAVLDIHVSPNNGPPLHKHSREEEGFYIAEGNFSFIYGDKEIKATKGMFIYAERGKFHRYKNVSDTPGKLVVVETPAGFEHFFEDAGILVDNIGTLNPPVDYQFDENRMSQIANKYGLQFK
jgi:quercetin dioxygenase-like cupin family protein